MVGLLLCALFAAMPTGDQYSISSGGAARDYVLFVPPGVKGKEAPLVLALHGFGQSTRDFERDSKLNEAATTQGFLVAYPAGLARSWNAGGCCSGADDIPFITAVLADIPNHAKVDEKRIYCTGMSNGGMMTYRLAAEKSDVFSAVMVVGGSLETVPNAAVGKPVSILHVHGTEDKIVPFDGIKRLADLPFTPATSADKAIAAWVKRNDCDPAMKTTTILSKDPAFPVTRDDYPPKATVPPPPAGADLPEVSFVVVKNGGHLWPGGNVPQLPNLGRTTSAVNVNALMWAFFQRHHR